MGDHSDLRVEKARIQQHLEKTSTLGVHYQDDEVNRAVGKHWVCEKTRRYGKRIRQQRRERRKSLEKGTQGGTKVCDCRY
jgi:hypothetical protein